MTAEEATAINKERCSKFAKNYRILNKLGYWRPDLALWSSEALEEYTEKCKEIYEMSKQDNNNKQGE
jgi:hypothetical protein